jgi:hypothetical protein
MQSERYNRQFRDLPPEYTMEELLDRHAQGLPLSWRDKLDVERALKARAGKEAFFPLHDTDDFATFWEANGESLIMDQTAAFQLACNCELLIGGGAAPLIRVGFVDGRAEP